MSTKATVELRNNYVKVLNFLGFFGGDCESPLTAKTENKMKR